MRVFSWKFHDEFKHPVNRLHVDHLSIYGTKSVLSGEITEQSGDILHRQTVLVRDKSAEDAVHDGVFVLLD